MRIAAQAFEKLCGCGGECEYVQVEIGRERELHIVVGFQVAGLQGNWRWGTLSAHGIAEFVVHAQIANEFCREQVGIDAVKGFADVRGMADYQEGRQQLANGSGVDIATRVARIERGGVVGVDSPKIAEAVLLLQLHEVIDGL